MKKTLIALVLLVATARPIIAQAAPPLDGINIATVNIVNAPDVRQWPATTTITTVRFDGSTTSVVFDKQDGPTRWPDVTPQGWAGPLQYTLWLFRQINGAWYGSAFIQFWHGRVASGSVADPDVPSRYHTNWFYDRRWAPINGSGPIQPGEMIGFMVTSGNQRDRVGPDSVHERSNVVLFPATDRGVLTFGQAEPVPTPTPTPTPVPPPTPPVPSTDLTQVLLRLDAIERAVREEGEKGREETRSFRDAVGAQWKNVLKYVVPALAALFAGRATN